MLGLTGGSWPRGALVKCPCLSLEGEMVAILSGQVSLGVRSRPFKRQVGVPELQGLRVRS